MHYQVHTLQALEKSYVGSEAAYIYYAVMPVFITAMSIDFWTQAAHPWSSKQSQRVFMDSSGRSEL